MQSNDDRRIRRTRRALTAALIELASQRPYETITIRDITDQADIGYATFFRHYESKDDLMLDIFSNIARELEAMGGQHSREYFEQEGALIFAHVQTNETLYRGILESLVFRRKLIKLFADHTARHIAMHQPSFANPAVPLDIAVSHMASSFVGLIEWWLEHKLRMPIEQIAQIYNRLIIQGTMYAVLSANPAAWPTK